MNNKPKISVLMTIYNHQNYLEQSIRSVLKQTYKNWELIACENGSVDNSKSILRKIKDKRIKKFFFKNNIGRTKCLNFALKKSKGELIAILDSDDIAKPNRFISQINYLKNENFDFVGSWYNRIDDKGKVIEKINFNIKDSTLLRRILFFNIIGHSTIMFKKNIIKKIGNYPNKFIFMQDYAFFLKVFKYFNMGMIEKNLTNCRYHHQNSETTRVSNTKVIENENVKLLSWSKDNFDLNIIELIYYYFQLSKLRLKIIKKTLLF